VTHLLIVEDERELRLLLRENLEEEGYRVTALADGDEALRRVRRETYDLVILDLMLPGADGLSICRALRSGGDRAAYVPILMLTARSSEIDRVIGLESGADDYLIKPFSVRELVARVRAILRRAEAMAAREEAEVIEAGDLSIDVPRRRVILGGEEVALTAKEFDLLACFAQHPGRVFSRGELLDHVWGYGHDGYEHTVNTHINRLRAKVEREPSQPRFVRTVWGVGYRFAEPHELDESSGGRKAQQ